MTRKAIFTKKELIKVSKNFLENTQRLNRSDMAAFNGYVRLLVQGIMEAGDANCLNEDEAQLLGKVIVYGMMLYGIETEQKDGDFDEAASRFIDVLCKLGEM